MDTNKKSPANSAAGQYYYSLTFIHKSCLINTLKLSNNVETKTQNVAKKFKRVTHCIFDMDGTVLDSEVIYHKMIMTICDQYGKKYTKDLQVRLYGVTDREICETVVKELKLPISINDFELKLRDMAAKELPSAPLMIGAERLLTHLYDYKIPMALATNSTEQAVRLHATARPKLFGMFHHKRPVFECDRHPSSWSLQKTAFTVSVTDPEVKKGKPHPDMFLIAASRFKEKPKPKRCLVFEDSACGVQAAKSAGMQVVMVPDPRLDRDQTRHATVVLKTLLDFDPQVFGLPPFSERDMKKKASLENKVPPSDTT